MIFNNYARFESSLQKVLAEASLVQSDAFSEYKRSLWAFEQRMSDLETKVASQPDTSSHFYAVVGKMKDQLKGLVSTAKGFDGMLGVIGGIHLVVDFPTDQLESILAFKNDNFVDQLRQKIGGLNELESRQTNDFLEKGDNDLCEVLDALVNDDTQDRIQITSSEATQFYPQKTPGGSKWRKEGDSPLKPGMPAPRFVYSRPPEPELTGSLVIHPGHAPKDMRRSTAMLANVTLMGLRKASLRDIQLGHREPISDEPSGNLRNIYEDRPPNRDYFPHSIIPDRLSQRNEPGLHKNTEDRNVYAKGSLKPKNAFLYGSNLVSSARDVPPSPAASGLSVRRVTPKNNYVTVLSKAGYVANQVIDEPRLREIVSSLRSLAGMVKQVEFSDNTFKCSLVPSLRMICPDGLAFPVKIDYKRNKFIPPQAATKKDKTDMALLNIILA